MYGEAGLERTSLSYQLLGSLRQKDYKLRLAWAKEWIEMVGGRYHLCPKPIKLVKGYGLWTEISETMSQDKSSPPLTQFLSGTHHYNIKDIATDSNSSNFLYQKNTSLFWTPHFLKEPTQWVFMIVWNEFKDIDEHSRPGMLRSYLRKSSNPIYLQYVLAYVEYWECLRLWRLGYRVWDILCKQRWDEGAGTEDV